MASFKTEGFTINTDLVVSIIHREMEAVIRFRGYELKVSAEMGLALQGFMNFNKLNVNEKRIFEQSLNNFTIFMEMLASYTTLSADGILLYIWKGENAFEVRKIKRCQDSSTEGASLAVHG